MDMQSEHPAVTVLRSFMAAMHDWEAEMLRLHQVRDWENSTEQEFQKESDGLRHRLAAIFGKYCEIGDRAHRVGDQLHCGTPEPDYNPQTERVVSVTERGGKVLVETKMAHNYKYKLKYELVEVNGQWRVRDNRKRSFEFETKWKPWPL